MAADIQLTSQVPSVTVYVLGNESQLYRMVSNLIVNAIQYNPAGGSVTVSLEGRDRTAAIAVKDTGIGIPDTGIGIPIEQQRRIFDRFYRVDGDRPLPPFLNTPASSAPSAANPAQDAACDALLKGRHRHRLNEFWELWRLNV